MAPETKAKIKCDFNEILSSDKKDNIRFYYNDIWFLFSFLVWYSNNRFKQPAAATKNLLYQVLLHNYLVLTTKGYCFLSVSLGNSSQRNVCLPEQ